MELIFPVAFVAILYYFRNKGEDFAKSLGKSLLLHQACVLLFANLLSIGNSLSRRTAFAVWLLVIAVVVAMGVKKQGKSFFCIQKEYWQIKEPENPLTMTERGMLVICIVLFGILLVGALFTVPYNYDSMTYHLARIGHWIDNGSVNYFLTNIDRQLYSPVLSEYNMLFLMLLSGGDQWLNLQQYVSMLITAYYIYKVTRMLGTDRVFSVFGVFVFVTMPLTISQSITTQNDLSAAMWYVLFLYYLLWFIRVERICFPWKEKKKKELPKANPRESIKGNQRESIKENQRESTRELVANLIAIGACVGFAFLMKVSVCASMMFFMPWLLVCCIRRKDKLKDLLAAAGIALGSLLVIISETLIRTYISCGSFIADTTSGDIMVATKNVSYIIVNILKNYSLLITQHLWTWINGFIYRIAISVGALLHVEVNNVAIAFHGFDFITYLNTGDDMYSHDRTSSAFAAYFALLAGVLLVIALIRVLIAALKKYAKSRGNQADSKLQTKVVNATKAVNTTKAENPTKANLSYGFVISAWLGFGFIMALLRWQPWGSRLMYPALAVTVIAGAHILGAFCRRIPDKKKAIVIIPLAALSFLLCLKPLDYNMQQAKKYLASGCENRTKYYFKSNKRYSAYRQLLKQAKQIKARDIAVVISGDGFDYPLWKMFHDQYPKANLRHILVDDTNMVLTEAEGEETPDCILWIERGRLEIGDTLDYNGQIYECVFVADSEETPDSLLIKKTP